MSIVGANMYEQLRLVGGLKLEKNGQFEFVCIRASLWNKDNDNAVRRIMKLLKSMGFKVKRMKVNQLYALIGFEEETIEVDFVGANNARVR